MWETTQWFKSSVVMLFLGWVFHKEILWCFCKHEPYGSIEGPWRVIFSCIHLPLSTLLWKLAAGYLRDLAVKTHMFLCVSLELSTYSSWVFMCSQTCFQACFYRKSNFLRKFRRKSSRLHCFHPQIRRFCNGVPTTASKWRVSVIHWFDPDAMGTILELWTLDWKPGMWTSGLPNCRKNVSMIFRFWWGCNEVVTNYT
jgi:hypothetical protein